MTVNFDDNRYFCYLKDIVFENEKSKLIFKIDENNDLYLDIEDNSKLKMIQNFFIPCDFEYYHWFEELYQKFITGELHVLNEYEKNFDKKALERRKKLYQSLNERIVQEEYYSTLVHDNIISWKSDELLIEYANLLEISKNNEGINFTIYHNPLQCANKGSIRIRYIDARYYPFNLAFMHLFNQFQEVAFEHENKYQKLLKETK